MPRGICPPPDAMPRPSTWRVTFPARSSSTWTRTVTRRPTCRTCCPEADAFARRMSKLGIGDEDDIVVYDGSGSNLSAARAWWMFRAFGHDRVGVLDGGIGRWRREGRPLEAGPVVRPRRPLFRAAPPRPGPHAGGGAGAHPDGCRADRGRPTGRTVRGPRSGAPSRAPWRTHSREPERAIHLAGGCRGVAAPAGRAAAAVRVAPASIRRVRWSPPAARGRAPAPCCSRSTCWASRGPRCTTDRGASGAGARTCRSRPETADDRRGRLHRAVSAAVRGGRRVRGGAGRSHGRAGRLGAGGVLRPLRDHLRRRRRRAGSSRSRGDAAGSPRRRPRRLDIPTSPGCGGRTGPRAGSRTATARRHGSPGPSRRSGTW